MMYHPVRYVRHLFYFNQYMLIRETGKKPTTKKPTVGILVYGILTYEFVGNLFLMGTLVGILAEVKIY